MIIIVRQNNSNNSNIICIYIYKIHNYNMFVLIHHLITMTPTAARSETANLKGSVRQVITDFHQSSRQTSIF